MKKILLTGGTGYIASHTAIELISKGYTVVLVDNLSNSAQSVVSTLETITKTTIPFYQVDVCNKSEFTTILQNEKPDAVIHFAALKAVGESVTQPLEYYRNNIVGLLSVLEGMADCNLKNFIFSSSATVYGIPTSLPLTEDSPVSATNPYGQTKLMAEQILKDLKISDPQCNIATLRYFNPVGAHESGLIGEAPSGVPNNLMPYLVQVASKVRESLSVYGNKYNTHDGTGERDYIHVVDLAKGHVKALDKLLADSVTFTINLGTGVGYTVLDMVHAFEKVNGVVIPYQIVSPRAGDIASCYADPALAKQLIGWNATKTLDDMMRDAWRWEIRRSGI